ncbi:axin-2-like [Xyrauchen texanus]|uniref:axin-2-like n=1 Tax=Xyrauchen texanus TaxID=154827 RepID=UPI0022427382|nr:axin-2-like [Xyrauchen texanus]
MSRVLTEPVGGSFRKDAPRPPVPGEEGVACTSKNVKMRHLAKTKPVCVSVAPGGTSRRNKGGMGAPEGSTSSDSPLACWTQPLHFLLGDQDGARLFRSFLETHNCVDMLDFWFACNGFRQMDLKNPKTQRVAKAIYKRYIENNSIVAKQMKPATKTLIRDCIKKPQVESSMFDQAQTEIQRTLEQNEYQLFQQHVRCESIYLPLIEDEEWSCTDLKALATVLGLSDTTLPDIHEHGWRSHRRGHHARMYCVNSAHVFASATSTHESEISSDATTDDSMSVTDSRGDGIPLSKFGSRKQQQREMQRSVKINGQTSQPHFPRTHGFTRGMMPVEPSAFAAELIARLEKVKRERDSLMSQEVKLQQIQEEEKRDGSDPPPSLSLFSSGSCEEDPQETLDEHLSRVLKTPGCQTPGIPFYSLRSRCPDVHLHRSSSPFPKTPCTTSVKMSSTKHIHHLYVCHQHEGCSKSREQLEVEAADRVTQCLAPHGSSSTFHRCHSPEFTSRRTSSLSKRLGNVPDGENMCQMSEEDSISPQLPGDVTDPSQNVWQWILESERQRRYKTHSSQGLNKSGRTPLWGFGGMGGHSCGHHPGHAFIQDSAMPPLPPPNTLAQLEEACRRLEDVSKPAKQRHSVGSLQRNRGHVSPQTDDSPDLQADEWRELRMQSSGLCVRSTDSELVVTYYFCGEEIPYRRLMNTHGLTLGHFKEQLHKTGNYRYYFKKASDEFECGAVFEEVWEDRSVLPMFKGKVLGKVEETD